MQVSYLLVAANFKFAMLAFNLFKKINKQINENNRQKNLTVDRTHFLCKNDISIVYTCMSWFSFYI